MDDKENSMLNYKGLKKILSNIKDFINKNEIKIDDTLIRSEDGTLGVAVPVKPITNAEYEKLDEDKKESSTVWAITDDTTGGGSASYEVYSTTETKIGTWIDGKPIYRKVFTGTSPTNSSATVLFNVDDLNIDTNTSITGYIYSTTEYMVLNGYGVGGASNSGYYTKVTYRYAGSYKGIVAQISESGLQNCPITVILEYTKTTDQATIKVQESSLITKNEKQEKSDYQDFIAPVTSGI